MKKRDEYQMLKRIGFDQSDIARMYGVSRQAVSSALAYKSKGGRIQRLFRDVKAGKVREFLCSSFGQRERICRMARQAGIVAVRDELSLTFLVSRKGGN